MPGGNIPGGGAPIIPGGGAPIIPGGGAPIIPGGNPFPYPGLGTCGGGAIPRAIASRSSSSAVRVPAGTGPPNVGNIVGMSKSPGRNSPPEPVISASSSRVLMMCTSSCLSNLSDERSSSSSPPSSPRSAESLGASKNPLRSHARRTRKRQYSVACACKRAPWAIRACV